MTNYIVRVKTEVETEVLADTMEDAAEKVKLAFESGSSLLAFKEKITTYDVRIKKEVQNE